MPKRKRTIVSGKTKKQKEIQKMQKRAKRCQDRTNPANSAEEMDTSTNSDSEDISFKGEIVPILEGIGECDFSMAEKSKRSTVKYDSTHMFSKPGEIKTTVSQDCIQTNSHSNIDCNRPEMKLELEAVSPAP